MRSFRVSIHRMQSLGRVIRYFKMSKCIILSVFALCIFSLGSCKPVTYEDCSEGSAMAILKGVDIEPCDQQPCILKKGTEETVQVTFIPKENITAAKTIVHGKVGPIWLPFSVDEPNACKDQGIVCPMTAGQEYTFKTVLPINSLYPSIQVLVKWEMHDQSDKVVYCFEVPAKIE